MNCVFGPKESRVIARGAEVTRLDTVSHGAEIFATELI